MIIEIVGRPGAGKTALNTLFLLRELKYKGQILQRQSAKIINGFNAERKNKLPFPEDRRCILITKYIFLQVIMSYLNLTI